VKKNHIVIHHSGTGDGPENNTAGIRRWHVEHNQWHAIGYHALVERVGESYEALLGRPWDWDGAHTIGHNLNSLGLCYCGNFMAEPPTDAQLVVGVEVVRYWMRLFGIGAKQVWPHGKLNATDCPGAAFPWDKFIGLVGG
jgi:hypothetical protein